MSQSSRNSRSKGHRSSFLTGLLIGAAAGAVAGILLAPRSGAESRHRLSEHLQDHRAQAHKTLQETSHQAHRGRRDLVGQLQSYWKLAQGALKAGRKAALAKHQELRKNESPEGGKP
jgi:gas vesicle protein